MAKHVRLMIVIGILTGTLGAPLIANAQTPLRFDCDAPVDQFSTEAQIVALPVTVVGTISALAMVSKDYVPSASVAIVSADDKNGVGFQMNAPADDATELDVDHVEMQRGVLRETPQGRVPSTEAIPFTLSVSKQGDVTVTVGTIVFTAKFAPLARVKVAATCTSGHFKYFGSLSNAEAATISRTP
jgi:hypothetical protein